MHFRGVLSLALSLAITCVASAAPAPVWLQACNKQVDAPLHSRLWQDAPVRQDLQDSLRHRGWTVRGTLRWNNRISAIPPFVDAPLPRCLENLGAVARSVRTPPPSPAARSQRSLSIDPAPITLARMHTNMGITAARDALTKQGRIPGYGMRIAVIDNGFVRQHKALQSATIVDAWDFVEQDSLPFDPNSAFWTMDHGTATAGLIVSPWSGLPGAVPGASLLLYRTEIDSIEAPVEEDLLAMAIERAVLHNVSVISISLGYRFYFDNGVVQADSLFDGRTLTSSRTALEAARRGVLVVAAAGNDAMEFSNRSVSSPADADSILTVGAVSEGGLRCAFSSYGPTWDKRSKPEVAGFGCPVPTANISSASSIENTGQGTSYATPLVAAAGLLLRQLMPQLDGPQIRAKLIASSRRIDTTQPRDTTLGSGLVDLRQILPATPIQAPRLSLPGVWRISDGPLHFVNPSDTGSVSLSVYSLSGRLLYQNGPRSLASSLWDGKIGRRFLQPGVILVRWQGAQSGSQAVVVVPNAPGL